MTDAQPRRQPVRKTRRALTRYQPQATALRWEARYAPAPGVTWSIVDREAVVSNQGTGRDYTLNPVGTAVWELLDGHRPLAAVLGALAESFDAPDRQLRRDLLALARELCAAGLIQERRQQSR